MNLFDHLRLFGDHPAVTDVAGKVLTYSKLAELAEARCALIGKSKQLVTIRCHNDIETVVTLISTVFGGHAAILTPGDSDRLFETVSRQYRPNWVCDSHRNGQSAIDHVNETVSHDMYEPLALLLPTSGSTGSPKLVRLTQKNLLANAKSISEYLGINTSSRTTTTLPLYYSYGLSVLTSHLYAGGALLLNDHSIIQKEFWESVRAFSVNSLAGVPYTYDMLRRLRFERMVLPELRYMTVAGGRMAPDSVRFYASIAKEKGFRFYVMYGQTEATARISYLEPDLALSHADSIGRAIPGGEMYIVDEDGRRVDKPNVQGELVYEGANVMLGYADRVEDLAAGDDLHGRLRTGDIATKSDESLFYITGRLKRVIKIHGHRINLDELQNQLSTLGEECICAGVDDALTVATLSGDIGAISQYLIETYQFHPTTFSIHQRAEFPVNDVGKISYDEIVEPR